MTTRTEQRHKHKKRKGFKWVLSTVIVLVIIGGASLFFMWNKISGTFDAMHSPLDRDQSLNRQKALASLFNNNQSINILLLGVDERSGDKGRSDTMILMSLNPKTNSAMMLSIPRDTYVNIPEHGMDKINHAYAYGGVPLSVQTVEDVFDLHMHFYTRINMEGFKDGIDTLGGITVHNRQAFSQDGHQFNEGNLHLNGAEALEYIRMRKQDPRGDIGRNERQRDVIKAAMDEAASFSNVIKVGELLTILGGNVQTNISPQNVRQLFSSYRGTRQNIKTLELNGSGKRIGGIWYYIVSDEEFNRITTEFNKHMNAK
ncbi:LCP family protein [Virgibacillus sp. MSJ-26]|uniref:LCP family glycopolymer transferase n=1 Tax=Virgibacillus sp. MSJ-26 TaxID=2841522 RepID=UPI001C11DF36|nr:LCP family protein [Virgibacillus sp. MSJ-26]MBU5467815.1 LCP family protein [Virgibacillus sp. MSJ-26]